MTHTPLQFVGPVEGYVANFLRKNQWRVAKTHDWEDSMQEAQLVFWKCRVRYPDVEQKHMMALFKTAWGNHFTDLAKKATEARVVVTEADLSADDDSASIDLQGSPDNEALVMIMLKQAPREVQTVLALFVSAPSELLEMAIQAWRAGGHRQAEGNKMINRCLGIPEDHDSIGNVRRYFLGN